MMGGYGFGGMSWIGMVLGLLVMIAVVVGLVFLVMWAVQRTNSNSQPPVSQNKAGPSARDIAQTRYAKGEINREEYQKILSDLGS
jgi:putative membrane protein